MAAVTRRQQAPNSYDLISYPGKPHVGAHCRNLEAIAALFKAAPVAPSAARVLELGCATAANFLPQASEYPDARFVGCDLSATAIASTARFKQLRPGFVSRQAARRRALSQPGSNRRPF